MQTEENRMFKMSNSDLAMFVSTLVVFMRLDETELAAMGISSALIDELEAIGNEFEIFPNDNYYLADVMIAVDKKNESRLECEKLLREIVGITAIKWGDRSPQVKRYEAGKATKMGDKVFMTMVRLAAFTAEQFLPELLSYGLTQAKIDALMAELAIMETEMQDIAKFSMIRELKTAERNKNANELYKLAAKYCEAGKVLWQDTDVAKYKNYVISRVSR